jgi:hypothetical protein
MTKRLLIGADDTLWENNVYFEQVRTEFLEFMQRFDELLRYL